VRPVDFYASSPRSHLEPGAADWLRASVYRLTSISDWLAPLANRNRNSSDRNGNRAKTHPENAHSHIDNSTHMDTYPYSHNRALLPGSPKVE
jgi:hypothetical protein